MKRPGGGALLVVAAALLFSTGGTVIKASSLDGPALAGLRSVVAAAFFFAWARRRGVRLAAHVDPTVVFVAAAYGATMVMFVVANKLTTAAHTIFLQSTAPLYVVAAAPLLLRERPTARDLVHAAVLAAGMTLFFSSSHAPSHIATDPALGDLVAAASGLTWAATIVGLRGLAGDFPRTATALVAGNLAAATVCAPWILRVQPAGGLDLAIVAYLGIVQVGLAYAALSAGVERVSAFEASLLLLLEPVSSALLAFAVHGESLTAAAAAGAVLIVGATMLRAYSESGPAATPPGRPGSA